jgi:hypothetical protein
MNEDEAMRARLRALAEEEALPQLDVRARARIESNVVAEVRRRETVRSWGLGLAAAGALAAAGMLLFGLPEQTALGSRGPRHASEDTIVERSHVPEPAAVCAEHQGAAWRTTDGNLRELVLGSRALLRTPEGAQVIHSLAANCDLRAELVTGSLAVHARDLRGGRLVVSTPRGEVVVKGTIFEVRFDGALQRLSVAVDEGLVEVRTQELGVFNVSPGQALVVGQDAAVESFAAADRRALRARLDLPVRELPHVEARESARDQNQAAPSAPSELHEQQGPLTEPAEERTWRPGSVGAPRLAPEPGSSVTEDGRPMSKPRVTP